MKRRKLLALMLTFALCFANIQPAFAEEITGEISEEISEEFSEETDLVVDAVEGEIGDNATWSLNNDGTMVISGSGALDYLESGIPYYLQIKHLIIGEGITSISSNLFEGCRYIESVSLPSTLNAIGFEAFSGCSSITDITLPESLTIIGSGAFYLCEGIKSIKIPDRVTRIQPETFALSGLKNIEFPSKLRSIEDNAFTKTKFTELDLPDSLEILGSYAFFDCPYLRSITIPDSVTYVGDYPFKNCVSLEEMTIGSGIVPLNLEKLCYNVYGEIRKITLTGNRTTIDASAFEEAESLEEIVLPDSITEIGSSAFRYCGSLSQITLPANIKKIGTYSFRDCAFETIRLPKSLESVSNTAFDGCNLQEVVFEGTECRHNQIKLKLNDVTDDMYVYLEGLGHDNISTANKPASFTSAGYEGGKKCADCGAVFEDGTRIAPLGRITLSSVSYTYNGKEQKPTVTLLDEDGVVIPKSEYYVNYPVSSKKVGSYSVTVVMASEKYEGSKTVSFSIKAASITNKTAKLSSTSYTYSGSAKKPTVTISGLKSGTDFSVSYKNNTSVGKATVTIKGKGNYTGTITKTFTIKPKIAAVSSATPGTKCLTVKMKTKVSSTGGTNYQIQYRVKGASSWKSTTTTAQSKKISSLTKGKKYQVRVRAYKIVNSKKYYGSWSTIVTSSAIN